MLLMYQVELSELTTERQAKGKGNLEVMRQALAVSDSFLLSHDTAFSAVSSF